MPRSRTETHTQQTHFQTDRVVVGLVIAYLAGLGMYGIMGIMVNPPVFESQFDYSQSAAAELPLATQADRLPPTASGELVQNGSFEEPIVRAASQFTVSVPGWSVSWTNDRPRQMSLTRQPGVEILAGYQGWKAAQGTQFVRMDSADLGGRAAAAQSLVTLSQRLTTQPGQAYIVAVSVAPQPKLPKAENQVIIRWNKEDVGTIALDGAKASAPQWKKYTFTVTGTGEDELALVGQGPENRAGMLLDAVSVTPAPQTK